MPSDLLLIKGFYEHVGVAISHDGQAIGLQDEGRGFFDGEPQGASSGSITARQGVEPLVVAKKSGKPLETASTAIEMLLDDDVGERFAAVFLDQDAVAGDAAFLGAPFPRTREGERL